MRSGVRKRACYGSRCRFARQPTASLAAPPVTQAAAYSRSPRLGRYPGCDCADALNAPVPTRRRGVGNEAALGFGMAQCAVSRWARAPVAQSPQSGWRGEGARGLPTEAAPGGIRPMGGYPLGDAVCATRSPAARRALRTSARTRVVPRMKRLAARCNSDHLLVGIERLAARRAGRPPRASRPFPIRVARFCRVACRGPRPGSGARARVSRPSPWRARPA